jgi:DNA-binding NtrC family response regulator
MSYAIDQDQARRRLLLVDDEPDFLEMLTDALTVRGFDVVAVGSVEAAFAAARNQHFDVAITDFKMPDTDGVEMVKALKALDARLPIIVASGYVSPPQWAALTAIGACAFLQKPFTLGDLEAALTSSASA